jgi:hypothetical protein
MLRHTSAVLVACLLAAGLVPSTVRAQAPAAQTIAATDDAGRPRLGGASLKGLFAETADDLRRLPSLRTVTILTIGAAGAAVGNRFDADTSRTLSASRDMATVFQAGQSLGSSQAQAAAAIATYAIGRATGHGRMAAVGADLVSAQIVTQITTTAVKLAVGRTRPDGTSFSFPSGHAATTFATATVLQRHFGWKVGIPAYAAATYVAASRIQVKRHYLSDVAFGAALGIVAGRSVTVGHGDATFAIAPAAAPGGGGVNFTWLGRR